MPDRRVSSARRTTVRGRTAATSRRAGRQPARAGIAALCLAVVTGSVAPASAGAPRAWTTIGAAGVVDEADRDLVVFNGPVVAMRNARTGVLDVRYNVVVTDGLVSSGGFLRMTAQHAGQ